MISGTDTREYCPRGIKNSKVRLYSNLRKIPPPYASPSNGQGQELSLVPKILRIKYSPQDDVSALEDVKSILAHLGKRADTGNAGNINTKQRVYVPILVRTKITLLPAVRAPRQECVFIQKVLFSRGSKRAKSRARAEKAENSIAANPSQTAHVDLEVSAVARRIKYSNFGAKK